MAWIWSCRCGYENKMTWVDEESARRGMFNHQAVLRCHRLPGADSVRAVP